MLDDLKIYIYTYRWIYNILFVIKKCLNDNSRISSLKFGLYSRRIQEYSGMEKVVILEKKNWLFLLNINPSLKRFDLTNILIFKHFICVTNILIVKHFICVLVDY